ncbi:beta clamp domain-containing protein [Prescottella equi]|uniref:DNA polymerase III, beta subunit n=1 Tax=Rhodococcus phage REQ2 TaxID=1109713 RepID=G9FGZ4_9CAUD|nr:DNA polymerase III, beta subunit [Prescottella equi]YP_005087095.1 RusA-like Holliday junction resolvase [Rhodococcus phage REQ2]AEV51905.1 DNA polymerase III, beta subunit [Rhodococcus phage REQ2]
MTTASFILTRRDLIRGLTTALTFAGKDDTLPMLCGVELAIHKGRLVIAATDRFRVGLVKLAPPHLEGADGRIGFVERSAASRILKLIGGGTARNKLLEVVVTITDSELTVNSPGEAKLTVPLKDRDFPRYRHLLQEGLGREGAVESWNVNMGYLADFKAAVWNSHEHATVRAAEPGRPIVVVIGEHFVGLQMPIRPDSETEYADKAQLWLDFLAEPEPKPARKRAAAKAPAKTAAATAPAKSAARKPAAKKTPVKRAPAKRAKAAS